MSPGEAYLDQGAWLVGFIKGITKHCYKRYVKALGLMVSEKKIVYVFPNVSLWELMAPACSEFGHDWKNLCRPSLNITTCTY